jgi:universal stress protein E
MVVIDPTTDAQPAFERSLLLAKQLSASLELTICAYHGGFADRAREDQVEWERVLAMLLERQTDALRKLAARATAAGISVSVDARWDHPPLHHAIIRKALDCGADLILKDTHYHPAIRSSLFSNTDWNLIRDCPTNLWLVKPRAPGTPFHILAAVDPLHEHDKPAELDHRILSAATALRAALRGDLHVFHAFDVAPITSLPAGLTAMPQVANQTLVDSLKKIHTEELYQLTDAHGIERDKVHIENGETRSLLLALADRLRVDVVVMGAVSRTGLKRLFIGGTAEAVLDKLNCDVLVIKPNRFETPVSPR